MTDARRLHRLDLVGSSLLGPLQERFEGSQESALVPLLDRLPPDQPILDVERQATAGGQYFPKAK
jgi:hypothetical protein